MRDEDLERLMAPRDHGVFEIRASPSFDLPYLPVVDLRNSPRVGKRSAISAKERAKRRAKTKSAGAARRITRKASHG